jgi:hypothetical protein
VQWCHYVEGELDLAMGIELGDPIFVTHLIIVAGVEVWASELQSAGSRRSGAVLNT